MTPAGGFSKVRPLNNGYLNLIHSCGYTEKVSIYPPLTYSNTGREELTKYVPSGMWQDHALVSDSIKKCQ